MSDQRKPARVSRRTVLIAAAGATPLVLVSGSAEAKMAQTAVKYQPTPKDGKQCSGSTSSSPNSCKSVAGDIVSHRMVLDLGEKGLVTIQPGVDRSLAVTNGTPVNAAASGSTENAPRDGFASIVDLAALAIAAAAFLASVVSR